MTIQLTTFGQGIQFSSDIHDHGFEFNRADDGLAILPLSFAHIPAVKNVLREWFGNDWFPLANNVERIPEEDYRGAGRAFFLVAEATGINPGHRVRFGQQASYYLPLLVRLGHIEWNQAPHGAQFRLL